MSLRLVVAVEPDPSARLVGRLCFSDLGVLGPSDGPVPAIAAARGFTGSSGTSLVVSDARAAELETCFLGAGERSSLDGPGLRSIAARLVRTSGSVSAASIDLRGVAAAGIAPRAAVQAVSEGLLLGARRFDRYRRGGAPTILEQVSILIDEEHAALAAEAAARGQLIARAVGTARDLVDTPAADCTPSLLAEMAVELCGASGVSVEVFDASRIAEERLGGLLGVARGSTEPPRLLMLRYDPRSTGREGAGTGEIPTVVLVGKGITFDSGGLSLKATEGMLTMKTDMAGAAAVIAALSACRDVGIEASVVGITPLTENMPGGSATKLGDVLRMRDGTTVEVVNTDAEGRLVLGDGLALAREQSPAAVIDLATLTGACVTALGRKIAGLMGNDEPLLASLTEASARCGEPVWRLPLPTQYRVDLDSEIAELKNMGAPRGGAGAIYAGLFLQHFVGTTPWAHLDIAGPARSDEDVDEFQKGATGFGVRLLLEWLSSLAIDRPGAPAGRP